MDYVENRVETAERVKKFWAKYGNTITLLILVVMFLIVGHQYWQRHLQKVGAQAAVVYENLLNNSGNAPQAAALGNQLMADYGKTPYASMAAFLLAKQAIAQSNLPLAQTQFQWVIAHTKVAAFKAIAKINMARVLLAQNQPAQAIDVLQSVRVKEFMGEALLVKGDALLASQQPDAAKAAYQQALNEIDKTSALYAYAEMKLYSL